MSWLWQWGEDATWLPSGYRRSEASLDMRGGQTLITACRAGGPSCLQDFHWYPPAKKGVAVPHYCLHVASTDNKVDGVMACLPLTMVKTVTPQEASFVRTGEGSWFLAEGVEVKAPHMVSSDF